MLTPGDLDEVVQSFLTEGDAFTQLDTELGEPGTAFVRLAALRRGFTESLEASTSMAGVTDCLENFLTGTSPPSPSRASAHDTPVERSSAAVLHDRPGAVHARGRPTSRPARP